MKGSRFRGLVGVCSSLQYLEARVRLVESQEAAKVFPPRKCPHDLRTSHKYIYICSFTLQAVHAHTLSALLSMPTTHIYILPSAPNYLLRDFVIRALRPKSATG
jgi:hypothetical protein